ncbi:LigA [Strigomonas culicis]|uniref:LigA n=1 Tax=Strigomonas culicis TaxID=28005 RepID=S9TLR2_9TRYP|nr:LigA [Strigomonas culicis]|eukprot:EPY17744.1 LigA [Strigomonas culicis]
MAVRIRDGGGRRRRRCRAVADGPRGGAGLAAAAVAGAAGERLRGAGRQRSGRRGVRGERYVAESAHVRVNRDSVHGRVAGVMAVAAAVVHRVDRQAAVAAAVPVRGAPDAGDASAAEGGRVQAVITRGLRRPRRPLAAAAVGGAVGGGGGGDRHVVQHLAHLRRHLELADARRAPIFRHEVVRARRRQRLRRVVRRRRHLRQRQPLRLPLLPAVLRRRRRGGVAQQHGRLRQVGARHGVEERVARRGDLALRRAVRPQRGALAARAGLEGRAQRQRPRVGGGARLADPHGRRRGGAAEAAHPRGAGLRRVGRTVREEPRGGPRDGERQLRAVEHVRRVVAAAGGLGRGLPGRHRRGRGWRRRRQGLRHPRRRAVVRLQRPRERHRHRGGVGQAHAVGLVLALVLVVGGRRAREGRRGRRLAQARRGGGGRDDAAHRLGSLTQSPALAVGVAVVAAVEAHVGAAAVVLAVMQPREGGAADGVHGVVDRSGAHRHGGRR